jgi:hypothetical protein
MYIYIYIIEHMLEKESESVCLLTGPIDMLAHLSIIKRVNLFV